MMKFNRVIRIGTRKISEDSKTFIIAEAGVNHNGDMNIAKKLIDIAVDSGVDAVKFQNFKSENLILKNIPKAPYQKITTGSRESQFDMLKRLEINKEETLELKEYCAQKKIIFLTTFFDEGSFKEFNNVNFLAYKVASTDITNLLFLKIIAMKHKPIILSTGMAYFSEVKKSLEVIHRFNKDVILLQCSANYPIKDEEANLNVIHTYKENFDVLVGYSDHTVGIGASPYAVTLGAKVIEKHFTLDKNLNGPDHKASLDHNELKQLVEEIRKVEKYLGSPDKIPTRSEKATRKSLQKCLVAAKQIKKNEVFTESNIIAKRTGGKGLSPIFYERIIGKHSNKDYSPDEILDIETL